MSRIRKLTPKLLKKIINEEKKKIKNAAIVKESNIVDSEIDNVTKLALKEAMYLREIYWKRTLLKKLKNKYLKGNLYVYA